MRSRLLLIITVLVISAGIFNTSCDMGGASIPVTSLKLKVDFLTNRMRAPNTAQTPSVYRVILQSLTLKGADPADDFVVFDTSTDCPVLEFTESSNDPLDMVPDGVTIPERPYVAVEMDIVALEMQLPFRFGGTTVEDRTVRIYYISQGPFKRGDFTLGDMDDWLFGSGNVTSDPNMGGLPRLTAYDGGGFWPGDTRPLTEYGPFGDDTFWAQYPDPAHCVYTVTLPALTNESETILVRVRDTWNFTDQDSDGQYDWPRDYGYDWHMDFPDLLVR
jgi:hypothetical protein